MRFGWNFQPLQTIIGINDDNNLNDNGIIEENQLVNKNPVFIYKNSINFNDLTNNLNKNGKN